MQGRKGIPSAIHEVQGTLRKHRHDSVAVTDLAVPECPATLSAGAVTAWGLFLPLLAARKVLTLGDFASAEMLCEAYAEWRELANEVVTEGRTYECTTEAGQVMIRPNPKVAMLSDARRHLNSMLAEFGLSPASRNKVQGSGESTPVNKFAKLGS